MSRRANNFNRPISGLGDLAKKQGSNPTYAKKRAPPAKAKAIQRARRAPPLRGSKVQEFRIAALGGDVDARRALNGVAVKGVGPSGLGTRA